MIINSLEDTIAAIATPLGTGGVGIVRISGSNAVNIVSEIFSKKLNEKILPDFKANRIYHGWIISYENSTEIPIDEVILLVFKAPKSYSGEDIIEIQCHGGINIVKNILELCLKSGARLAEKGEFTKRAFLNGKLDLSKAEAVLDLIHSKTDKFSMLSAHNLSGKLTLYINNLREELLNLLSLITAAIDFPEEVNEPDYNFLEKKIDSLIEKINSILSTAENSCLMRHGLKIAIVGKPNVGKSSLFNALLNIKRSIVTDIPGTTRDIIQEALDIDGIPVTLIDTAGIREIENNHSSDYIESIGINIARSYIKEADIIIFVHDLTCEINEKDNIIYKEIKDKSFITVGSKSDLANNINLKSIIIPVSSKTGEGLDLIKKEIKKIVFSKGMPINNEFSTNIRQQECLIKAKKSLLQALESVKNKEIQDFIAIDLKAALISLGEITGEVISDKIINNIFSNFCIGK